MDQNVNMLTHIAAGEIQSQDGLQFYFVMSFLYVILPVK